MNTVSTSKSGSGRGPRLTWPKFKQLFFAALMPLGSPVQPLLPHHAARIPANADVSAMYFLSDPQDRITEPFSVPVPMTRRVSFWFNVYTKWDSQKHILHHARYPWIVFKIIDSAPIMDSNQGHYWTRYHKARAYVLTEKRKVQQALKSLAYRKNYYHLNETEQEIFTALAEVQGPRTKVFRFALENLRSQLGQQDFFISGLRNSSRYLTYMEEEFQKLGLPGELTRIPFVESSFNENAESKVGASGIWQIMPVTGRSYMRVEKFIDERNSPIKATRASGKLLKSYTNFFKSFPLAITAYNHGIGSLQKAIKATRTRELPVIIETYHQGSFKFASSNFFACFLAALHAEKYSDEIFGHMNLQRRELMTREVFSIDRKIRTRDVIEASGLDIATFTDYNMDLKDAIKHNALIPVGFELHLPVGKVNEFYERLNQAPQKQVEQRPGKRDKSS